MLLWSHKDKLHPSSLQRDELRGEIEARNLPRRQVAETVTEYSSLELVYSALTSSELVIMNQAEGPD